MAEHGLVDEGHLRGLRVLTFGTLFPDSHRPQHGIFVERRLGELRKQPGIDARVVAPVPWFPSGSPLFGAWSEFARVARREVRDGVVVDHPRFPVLPRIGMNVAPWLLARWALPALQRVRAEGFDFDVIDAQYYYPDGVAAVLLGRKLGRPVTVTARGSDLNVIARYPLPRRMIRYAAAQAAASIAVCDDLARQLITLGAPPERVQVLRNGVDLTVFAPPRDRARLRSELGVTDFTLLAVGNLVPLKGHHLIVAALGDLPGVTLAIAGSGPEEANLRRLVAGAGLAGRVRFLGRLTQPELCRWYGAADALVLPSESEGLANVLLEAMACGTPVAATAVGGTPEVVDAPDAGVLIGERSIAGVRAAVNALRAALPERAATRRHAERFSWAATASSLARLLSQVAADYPRRR